MEFEKQYDKISTNDHTPPHRKSQNASAIALFFIEHPIRITDEYHPSPPTNSPGATLEAVCLLLNVVRLLPLPIFR